MSGLWRPKKRRNPLLIGVVIVVFVVLLGVFIVANVAGQAYEKDFFTSSQYNPSSSHGFPSNFLGGLLQNKPSCSDFLIQRGDVVRTNHSLFEYKVIQAGAETIAYDDASLQNCFVQEILITSTSILETTLPTSFGFFPKVKILVSCETPNLMLETHFTYANNDPLEEADSDDFENLSLSINTSSYWAEAVLIYWWDQLAVNLTQANQDTFNSSLQSVLLRALYPNNTQTDLNTDATITTSITLSNASRPISFTRQPSAAFSTEQLDLLNELDIFNASAQIFEAAYWAVNLDLGQFSSQNIFTNPTLLADATDIFHDNPFISSTFQDTPLTDGTIPGDGYRGLQSRVLPPTQTNASLNVLYQCWRWVRKPILLALMDVAVPAVVLAAIIGCLIYFLLSICCPLGGSLSRRGTNRSHFTLVPQAPRDSAGIPLRDTRTQSFETPTRDRAYSIPQIAVDRASTIQTDQFSTEEIGPSGTVYRFHRRSDPSTPRTEEAYEPQSDNTTTTLLAGKSPEFRTQGSESSASIMETPVVQRGEYRISPKTAQVFEAHARRMAEEDARMSDDAEEFGIAVPGPSRGLSQRKSNTDLRRMKAVK